MLAHALRAREKGNIALSELLVAMALQFEDAAIAMENAAKPKEE